MIICRLTRTETSDAGTFGFLKVGDAGPTFYAAQLPKAVGVAGESLVPASSYPCQWVTTPKHPDGVYKLIGVPNNPNDEIHKGNFAGDASKVNPATNLPYRSDVTGCTLLGKSIGSLDGQKAVLQSTEAIEEFQAYLGKQDFMLVITDAFE